MMIDDKYSEMFADFEGKKQEVIPLLQEVQKTFGFLPDESMEAISEFTGLPSSHIYSVATFYSQFRFTPVGENHIMVCRGTACHVKGATRILEELERRLGISEGETTEDGKYSLETVACIGACGMAPTMVVDKATHGRLTVKRVTEILKETSLNLEGAQNG